MILHSLALRRFLGLEDHAFDFAPGLNVVVGANEAGKSTLRLAIRTVLYENPATTSSELREKFQTWGTSDPPEVRLEFEIGGTRFRLTKSFSARKVELVEVPTGRTWEQHKLVQERLVEVLGLASDKIFDATAHIAQAELERIHLNSIAKELGRIIGGGGEDVTTALRRLEAHVRALERGTKSLAKDPGILAATEIRVRALREELAGLERNAAAAERARQELAGVTGQGAELRESLAAKSALLEHNRESVKDEERLAQLKREEAMWEKKIHDIEGLVARLTALTRDLERTTAQGVPDEGAVREARLLRERMEARTQDLAALTREGGEQLRPPSAPWRPWAATAVGAIAVFVGLLTLRALGVTAWLLVAIGAIATGLGGRAAMRAGRNEQLRQLRLEERVRRRVTLEDELDDLRGQMAAATEQLGSTTVEEAEARFSHYRDLVQERRQVAAFLDQLRDGSNDEAIAERWKTVRRDIFGLHERLQAPEVAAKRLTPLQIQALEREVAELTEQVTQVQRKEMKLTVDLERFATDGEQLAVKAEALQEAEETLARVHRHHQVCREALSGLQRARELAQIPLRTVVETRAGQYLAAATDARYTRIVMEPETLELSVWSPDAGDWIRAAEPHLSRGTIDLVYLAVRLALVGVLTNGRRPPLLFDDPFITFDDHRREGAMQLLRELSGDHQVFLFTCTAHYDHYADKVLHLPDRAAPVRPPDDVRAAPRRREPASPASSQASEHAPVQPAVGPLWEQPPE